MNPSDRERLAAEYALGVLEGRDLDQAEALFATDPAFTRAVTDWNSRLAELDRHAQPLPVGEALWSRIAAALPAGAPVAPSAMQAEAGAVPTPPTPARPGWWFSLGFWRPAALTAGFAAMLLAVGLGVAVQRAQRAPVLVAVLLTDSSRPAAVVNAFADGRTELIPLDAIAVPPGKALEIWTLWDRARGPVSVGLIDAARRVDLRLDGLPRRPDQLFEITLEPATGSPTGRPTGPVLMKGTTSPTL
ncbi:anti-sigma factor [Alsobacter sp. R-9]